MARWEEMPPSPPLSGTRGVEAQVGLVPGPGPHAVPVSLAELIKRRLTEEPPVPQKN